MLSECLLTISFSIPLGLFLIVMGFLYRRSIKKRRLEDMNDRTKSLDFGMGDQSAKKAKDKRPELQMSKSEAYQVTRNEKGVSMDLGPNCPYLLPAVIQGSRESIHSLSRTTSDPNDPYRPSAFARSVSPSFLGSKTDSASLRTPTMGEKDAMSAQLLRNPQGAPSSTPPPPFSASSTPITTSTSPPPPFPHEEGLPAAPNQTYKAYYPSANKELVVPKSDANRDSSVGDYAKQIRQSNEYLAAFLNKDTEPPPSAAQPTSGLPSNPKPPPPVQKDIQPTTLPPKVALPAIPSLSQSAIPSNPASNTTALGYPPSNTPSVNVVPAETDFSAQDDRTAAYRDVVTDEFKDYNNGGGAYNNNYPPQSMANSQQDLVNNVYGDQSGPIGNLNVATYDTRRLSMGLRPLPPEDPSDNPEQRANRIRSFYKEYFDPSKPDPFGYYEQTPYYEDYGYGEYNPYDQAMQPPAAPYAQGMGRRAMTPPPRQASRFHGMPGSGYSGSAGDMTPPRAASSMSARKYGDPRGLPKKRLPPPGPLMTLPTPHRLKQDAMIYGVIDYAPPTSFRDRQLGRPDSPLGMQRPYSPSVRAHLPLASSYDDLNVMPSP